MADSGRTRTKRKRGYAPKLEALEALKLLDASTPALLPFPAEHDQLALNLSSAAPAAQPRHKDAAAPPVADHLTWDTALGSPDLAHWRSQREGREQAEATSRGIDQLNRYLARTWNRAGIKAHQHEDCTQAVHASLLQLLERNRFDSMLSQISERGIPQVLNRESPLGPDFFRTVDMIKKRALRQKSHLALDDQLDMPAANGGDGASESWRGVLSEAIARSLEPREADLIRATLEGYTPAEIASRWGLAPKTVSNEKTRALQKLRSALATINND